MDASFPVWLAAGFFAAAILYASVGFGGGSTYTALLAAAGVATTAVPVVSLACNLVVVAGGAWHFARRGHLSWPLTWPFLAASIPAAYLGGCITLPSVWFHLLLGSSLCLASICLVFRRPQAVARETAAPRPAVPAALALGVGLGLLSGLVGIGGGIFLAPILLLLRWGQPKQVAATAAVFIGVNSLAGLAGHFGKSAAFDALPLLLPLALAVLVGGQIGSRLGAGPLAQATVRRITGLLVLMVGLRLLWLAIPQFTGGIPS